VFNQRLKESGTKPADQGQQMEGTETQVEELYFVVKEKEPFVRKIRVEFQIEFTHERAVVDLENFETLIDEYYELAPKHNELREHEQNKRREQEESQQYEKERQKRAKKDEEEREKSLRFPGSALLQSREDKDQLLAWLEEARGNGNVKKLGLLFRASRDGFGSQSFHRQCDAQGPTVVVFQTRDGKRGGGYANISWHSRNQWAEDSEGKSFLFSLDHRTKHNFQRKPTFAIRENPSTGPTFGGGHDLCISSNCNINSDSYCLPHCFAIPHAAHLGGSQKFQVADYEVWKVE